MNHEQFKKIVADRMNICMATLIDKGAEYASDTDRLHNFKVAAAIDNEEPVESLWGMFKKHLVSIIDMKNNPDTATKALMDAKLTDAHNYLLLMEAVLVERNNL